MLNQDIRGTFISIYVFYRFRIQDTNTGVGCDIGEIHKQQGISDPGIDLVSTMDQIASKVDSIYLSDASCHIY